MRRCGCSGRRRETRSPPGSRQLITQPQSVKAVLQRTLTHQGIFLKGPKGSAVGTVCEQIARLAKEYEKGRVLPRQPQISTSPSVREAFLKARLVASWQSVRAHGTAGDRAEGRHSGSGAGTRDNESKRRTVNHTDPLSQQIDRADNSSVQADTRQKWHNKDWGIAKARLRSLKQTCNGSCSASRNASSLSLSRRMLTRGSSGASRNASAVSLSRISTQI